MVTLRKHLEKLRRIKRRSYHPLVHKLHKKHKISKKTLFYVKEYGPHTNVPRTIIKESMKILLLASIISSLGGFALEQIKIVFISIMPLVILFPALNGMIGNYGCVVASRFSTMLHEGKIRAKWWLDKDLKKLFLQLLTISMITAIISSTAALVISGISGYALNNIATFKIIFIILLDVFLLISLSFIIAIIAGIHFFKKKEDPNNFLIPITTSVADFGNMIILSILVVLLF